MKLMTMNNGQEVLVDKDVWEKIKDKTLFLNTQGARVMFCIGSDKNKNRKQISLSRFIMNPPKEMVVDHISGDILDNRRKNLRVCSNQQNGMNRSPNAGQKYKGVMKKYPKREKPWYGQIKINNKSIHLGVFKTPEEAALAYNYAAIKYYGEFARLNIINNIEESEDA